MNKSSRGSDRGSGTHKCNCNGNLVCMLLISTIMYQLLTQTLLSQVYSSYYDYCF